MARSIVVSCIVPFFNAAAWLPDQLEALSRQTCRESKEFLFADNGSTDESRAVIEAWAGKLDGKVRVIDAAGKRGAAYARNCAVGSALGEWLAFCDADDRVNEIWLEALLETARRTGAEFTQGMLRDWEGGSRPNASEVWNPAKKPHLSFLPLLQSGNMLGRADVIRALQGWNEDFLTAEDVEFGWRAQLTGYRLASSEQAILDYRTRTSYLRILQQCFRWGMYDVKLLKKFSSFPRRPRTWRHRFHEMRPIPVTLIKGLMGKVAPSQQKKTMKLFGKKMGHVAGSLRHRYFYL